MTEVIAQRDAFHSQRRTEFVIRKDRSAHSGDDQCGTGLDHPFVVLFARHPFIIERLPAADIRQSAAGFAFAGYRGAQLPLM